MIHKYKFVAAIALAATVAPFPAMSAPQVGPTGHYYEVVPFATGATKTWDAANTGASGMVHRGFQGYLATITSAAEDSFIEQRRQAAGLNPGEAWVGGRQVLPCSPEPTCGWQWVNGEGAIPTQGDGLPGHQNWLPYQSTVEPNNLNNNEHHLAIGLGGNFGWNDEGALGNIGGYVVEYPGLVATDDTAEATSGVPKAINVIANDVLGTSAAVAAVEIVSDPTAGGATPSVGPAPNFLVTYTSPTDFPDTTGDTDTFEYKVTDQYGAFAIATVSVTVVADVAVVGSGPNQLIFNQAQDPAANSNNPMTAAYQQVLQGGEVTISCCRVLDTRETPAQGRKPAKFKATTFDLGKAVADTYTNTSCEGMPHIPQGKAVLRPWQRGVPKSQGFIVPGSTINARENDLGVCMIEANVSSRGVVFSAEEAANVLGFGLNGAVDSIRYRPFTGGVSLDPTEVDAPYATPWTAEWDESRSGKRFSDNVMVVNLWHEWLLLPSVPYLLQLASSLESSILQVRDEGCVENNAGFLDDLRNLVQHAKVNVALAAIPWWRDEFGKAAVRNLSDATRLALLIGADAPPDDPYGLCPGNPEGLFVGRSMALTHATCSELVNTFGDATVFSDDEFVCKIPDDILCELPELPGFERPPGSCPAPSSP